MKTQINRRTRSEALFLRGKEMERWKEKRWRILHPQLGLVLAQLLYSLYLTLSPILGETRACHLFMLGYHLFIGLSSENWSVKGNRQDEVRWRIPWAFLGSSAAVTAPAFTCEPWAGWTTTKAPCTDKTSSPLACPWQPVHQPLWLVKGTMLHPTGTFMVGKNKRKN